MNPIFRPVQFKNGSHGFVRITPEGNAFVQFGNPAMDASQALAAMQGEITRHTPTALPGTDPESVAPVVQSAGTLDWTPPTLSPGVRYGRLLAQCMSLAALEGVAEWEETEVTEESTS